MTKNQDLQQRRDAAFARGLGNQLPVYVERARNAELWDVEGRRYIDFAGGIAALLAEETVYAYAFEGRRYDCGSKLGYLEATVEFGLKHDQLGDRFANFLARLVADRLRR